MLGINSVTIKGFKSIESIDDFDIMPINVIIGANGAGKSNFIEAFSFLHELINHLASDDQISPISISMGRELDNYVALAGGANNILHFGTKITKRAYIVFGVG